MGDDAQSDASAATTLTEPTAPPATAQDGGSTSPATPTDVTQAPPEQQQDDIWARVAELDLDELIRRNPRLQGKVGSLAQQQSQKAISEYQSRAVREAEERAAEAHRAELLDLARNNPDALAERVAADIAKQTVEERTRSQTARAIEAEHTKLANELNAFYRKPIVEEVWGNADAETRAKLTWTNYDTVTDFLEAAAEVLSEYRSEKKSAAKAEELAKKRFEAMMKEANIEKVKTDAESAKADLNLDGLSSGTRIFTREEIKAMPLEEYRKHKTAIRAQVAAGYVR